MPEFGADDFASLLERAKSGDAAAQSELVEQYGPTVLGVVRRRLNARLRSLFDSSDFTQNAWFEFFTKILPHRTFTSSVELRGFLSVLACHTVDATNRKYLELKKYDLHRQQSLESGVAAAALIDSEPSADEIVAQDELVHQLILRLRPSERGVLDSLIAGCTHREIADQHGVDERTIARIVRRIVTKIEGQRSGDSGGGGGSNQFSLTVGC